MTIVIIIKEKLQTESMKVLSEKKDSSRQVILAKWNGDLKKGGGLNTAPRGAENTDGSYAIKGSDEDEGLTPVREYKLQRWSSAEMSAFSNDNKKWRTHAQNGKAQHVKTWKLWQNWNAKSGGEAPCGGLASTLHGPQSSAPCN